MPLELVDRESAFHAVLDDLTQQPAVGVDTESNSLYRYHERVCLIQISTPTMDYVIDPLAVDVRPLGELFSSPGVEKVFHAGEYDILCLKRDYGFSFHRVFDTMIAGRVLGLSHLGLSAMLGERFGLRLDKKMQRADWGKRPLDDHRLQYAAMDSRHLIVLRDALLGELQARGLTAAAREGAVALCRLQYRAKLFNPDSCLRWPEARTLEATEQAVLRELFCWREETAKLLDEPPFRILSNDSLVRLALLQPRSLQALEFTEGSCGRSLQRYGPALLLAIARGSERARSAPLVRQS
ncbi:MAG: ribonuclease D [Anaerolineae bacterium]